jgi:hypothetical protein
MVAKLARKNTMLSEAMGGVIERSPRYSRRLHNSWSSFVRMVVMQHTYVRV